MCINPLFCGVTQKQKTINSSACHSFVAKYVGKSHSCTVAITEPMFIHLATGSKVVLDLMYTVPIVFVIWVGMLLLNTLPVNYEKLVL